MRGMRTQVVFVPSQWYLVRQSVCLFVYLSPLPLLPLPSPPPPSACARAHTQALIRRHSSGAICLVLRQGLSLASSSPSRLGCLAGKPHSPATTSVSLEFQARTITRTGTKQHHVSRVQTQDSGSLTELLSIPAHL